MKGGAISAAHPRIWLHLSCTLWLHHAAARCNRRSFGCSALGPPAKTQPLRPTLFWPLFFQHAGPCTPSAWPCRDSMRSCLRSSSGRQAAVELQSTASHEHDRDLTYARPKPPRIALGSRVSLDERAPPTTPAQRTPTRVLFVLQKKKNVDEKLGNKARLSIQKKGQREGRQGHGSEPLAHLKLTPKGER